MDLQSSTCSLIGVCAQKLEAEEMAALTGTPTHTTLTLLSYIHTHTLLLRNLFSALHVSLLIMSEQLHSLLLLHHILMIFLLCLCLRVCVYKDRIMQLLLQVFSRRGATAHEVRTHNTS